jgi:hypothetical protein
MVFERQAGATSQARSLHYVSRMRNTTHVVLAAVLAAALASEAAIAAQGRGRGHANGRGARNSDQTVVLDRDDQRRIVRDYYTNNGLPPGLAKRESLPPGLAKQLRERGQLPPGLQKRLTTVPAPLTARLPRLPGYYDRYFAGDDLLVVDRRSNRIVSLIPNIF